MNLATQTVLHKKDVYCTNNVRVLLVVTEVLHCLLHTMANTI